MEALVFDLERVEVPVELRSQDGTVQKYVLKELDGEGSVRYSTQRASVIKRDAKGEIVELLPEFHSLEPFLVSLCLYDSEDKLVPESTIRSWKAQVQGRLYRTAREISGMATPKEEEVPAIEKQIEELKKRLEEAKKDQLGNLSSSSTVGSG